MGPGDVVQSALAAAGAQASSIHSLSQLMFWTCVTVFSLVMAFLLVALVHGLQRKTTSSERALTRSVATAVTLTVVVLIGLLVASVTTGRTVAAHANAVTMDVSGHQWWEI